MWYVDDDEAGDMQFDYVQGYIRCSSNPATGGLPFDLPYQWQRYDEDLDEWVLINSCVSTYLNAAFAPKFAAVFAAKNMLRPCRESFEKARVLLEARGVRTEDDDFHFVIREVTRRQRSSATEQTQCEEVLLERSQSRIEACRDEEMSGRQRNRIYPA